MYLAPPNFYTVIQIEHYETMASGPPDGGIYGNPQSLCCR